MTPVVEVNHVTKKYEKNEVLKNVTLRCEAGRIYGLIGRNGSGKTVLLKSICGFVIPTSGEVRVWGKQVGKDVDFPENIGFIIESPGFLLQESGLRNLKHLASIQGKIGIDEIRQSMNTVGLDPDLKRHVGKYSMGMRQRLGIAQAIMEKPDLLILDEPTASLNEDDSKALLDLLLKFKKQGMTSIIISHKLNEISYVADKITVIRDGSTIETLDKKKDDFSEGMVGREMTDRFPKRPNVKIGDVSMEVKNWNVYHPLYTERKVVNNVSFKVHKGEVVGISGLMGAGRTELAMSIFGKSYGTKISGQVFMNGKEVKLNTVQEAIDNKLAYVTEDRKGNGLILSKSIKMNTTLANMSGISNGKVIDTDKEYAVAEEYRKKLKTKCPTVEQNVGNLSGGNQQKVLLAKWMFAEPDILILDEPTRGIDVGAKYEIYCIINDLVAAGKSVIMISSELPEVLGMSDRIYIMNEGRFVGEVSGEEATSELIMSRIVKSGKGE